MFKTVRKSLVPQRDVKLDNIQTNIISRSLVGRNGSNGKRGDEEEWQDYRKKLNFSVCKCFKLKTPVKFVKSGSSLT